MKEIKTILELVAKKESSKEKFAIAQVVNVEGSSYRREGARMIVFESGIFEGGISGGCLEGDTLKRSQLAILKQKPSLVTYDTSKEQEIGVSLGCNGVIDVLMTPVTQESSALKILKKCSSERKPHVIITITSISSDTNKLQLGDSFYYDRDSNEILELHDSQFKDFLLESVQQVYQKKRSGKYHFQSTEMDAGVFIEIIPAQFHLAVFGDNYDVYPIVKFAKVLDWDISLVGNMQKLKKEKIEGVTRVFHKDFEGRPEVDDRTAIILMAHDFKTDMKNLKNALNTGCPYIASLGPKKRFDKMLTTLKEEGIALSDEDMSRIYAPSGLEIGANTPEEIALSIFSEIIAVFTGKEGGMLKFKTGPIHDRD